ncbi:hypothetical protein MLD38_025780 [Melastoma candidum]|nr:hypothetical protein MLD38_025780 [Melastoma candidum]
MALLRRNSALLVLVLLAILLLCSFSTEAAFRDPALANADLIANAALDGPNNDLPVQDDLDTKEQVDVSATPSSGASAPSTDEALLIASEVIVLGH